jgi:hypothetical protein
MMHGGTLDIDDHVYSEAPRQAGTLVRVGLQAGLSCPGQTLIEVRPIFA